MPKLFKPAEGQSVYCFLEELEGDAPFEYLKGELANSVNVDSCCDQHQQDSLLTAMNVLCDESDDCENRHSPKYESAFENLVAMANGFRLHCANCLNFTCTHRDPDYPIEKVQARVTEDTTEDKPE